MFETNKTFDERNTLNVARNLSKMNSYDEKLDEFFNLSIYLYP